MRAHYESTAPKRAEASAVKRLANLEKLAAKRRLVDPVAELAKKREWLTQNPNAVKTCTKCFVEHRISGFNKLAESPDGHAYYCKQCQKAQNRTSYLANTERAKRQAYEWKLKNPERAAEISKAALKKYAQRHPDRLKAAVSRWAKKNKPYLRMKEARKKAQKKSAAPKWDLELDTLVEIEARDLKLRRQKLTGKDWHIDHIVPLACKTACGLHNAYNLAVVPARYNMSKRNSFCESMLSNREWLWL